MRPAQTLAEGEGVVVGGVVGGGVVGGGEGVVGGGVVGVGDGLGFGGTRNSRTIEPPGICSPGRGSCRATTPGVGQMAFSSVPAILTLNPLLSRSERA